MTMQSQQQQEQSVEVTASRRSPSVQPWHQSMFDVAEVTPTNFHQRSRRHEAQLPLPEVDPMVRANVLLEESMRHNWANNARVFQQHTMLKAQSQGRQVDLIKMQEELEFMWFQFRCEWQQLRTDVLSEMFRVPVPDALKSSNNQQFTEELEQQLAQLSSEELEEKLREQARRIEAARKTYLEDLRQAFYPTTLMELFQKDLAPFEEDMNLCLLPSGRGHWAQLQATYLYQQQLARQVHEAERLRRQQLYEKMTLANLTQSRAPEIAIELCEIDLDEDEDDDDSSMASSSHSSHVDISNYHLQATIGGHMPARSRNGSSESCDDASSVCGMSSAESAISSTRSFANNGDYDKYDTPELSPSCSQQQASKNSRNVSGPPNAPSPPAAAAATATRASSPLDGALKRTSSNCSRSSSHNGSEDIAYPTKPMPMCAYQEPAHLPEVMEALGQLTSTEGQQCPLEYHAVRYDEETRAQVFMSRRERKAFILAAMPRGRLFMTV